MRKNKKYVRQRRTLKAVKITLITLLVLVVSVVGIAALYVNHLLDKVDYDEPDETYEQQSYETDEFGNIILGEIDISKDTDEDDEPGETLDDEEAARLAEEAAKLAGDDGPLMESKDVINILLIGVDARVAGQVTNSDVMMLISVNKAKKTITLSSLMRDMYVAIPGVGNTKLNHANSIGGPTLLLETVRNNFRVNVTDYMMVDFYSMANIVDILGGVTVNVTDAELPLINGSVSEMNRQQGKPASQGHLASAGTVNLTGPQAVGYARIRKVGNADFGRTERQRTIMTAIINKTKGSSLTTLNSLANEILPQVRTNLSKNDILTLMTLVPQAVSYPMTQLQIPAQGHFSFATIGGLSYLVPDIQANRDLLASTIY